MTKTIRTATLGVATASLLLTMPAAPVNAAEPKPAKPVLTCKTKTQEGLSYTVIKAGKGEKPGPDSRVEVNYSGRLQSDGSEFDSGEGAKFKVGGVIAGFAQGLKLMQAGGKYRICIPAALGYGVEGSDPIPPNADLVFEVELLSFTTPPPKPVIPADARACDQSTASGLNYSVIKQGIGRAPTAADMALIDLTTFDPETGVVIARRDWETIPMTQATALFAEALGLMQAGASYRFCVPKGQTTEDGTGPAMNIIVDLLDVRVIPPSDD